MYTPKYSPNSSDERERIVSQTRDAGAWIGNLDETLDLRRKTSRDRSARIIRRAHWLSPEDREIVLAYFERDMCASEIGQLLKVDPKYVRRQLKQIVHRLEDPRCAYVVANRNAWTPKRRAIAEDLFLRGRSMRDVSKTHKTSLHMIRKHRDAIDAMAHADQQQYQRPTRTWQTTERVSS